MTSSSTNPGDFAQALAGQAQQQTVSIANQISVASLKHVQNAGTTVDASIRSSLNLIAGTGVSLSFADDSVNDRVSVTVGASAVSGTELDYAQITSPVTGITVSTDATATTVIAGNPITYDGTRVKIEVFCPDFYRSDTSAQTASGIVVVRDSTIVGTIRALTGAGTAPSTAAYVNVATFDTPTAGSHTYKAAVFTANTATAVFGAGLGGSGNVVPAWLRVTKA